MPSLYPGAPAAVTASAKTRKKTTTAKPATTTVAPAATTALPPAAPINWGAVAKAFGVGAGPSTAALTGQARTAAQQDTNYAVGAYRAEQDQATRAAAARAGEINRAAQGAGSYVQSLGLGNQLQQSFSQAAADQGALAAGLSGDLRQTVQAAGDKARAAIAQINGGGLPDTTQQAGNAVYGMGGLLPANALAAAAPAAVAAANQVAPNIVSYGQQQGYGAIQAGREQAQALEPDIAAAIAKQPQLEHSYLTDFQTAADRKTKQAQDAMSAAIKAQQAGDSAEATRLWRNAQLTAKAAQIDPAVSKLNGYLSYGDGTAALDAKGKPIPVTATGAAAKPYRYQDSYGREIQLNPDGSQQALTEGHWTDSAGTTYRVGIDGKQTVVSTKPAATTAPSDTAGTAPPRFDSANSNALGIRTDQYGDPLLYGKDKHPVLMPGWKIGKDGMPVKTGSSSTSAPTTKKVNGVTYQWDAGTRRWIKSGLPTDTTTTKAPGPYPNLTKAQVIHLRSGVANAFYGVPEQKDVNGKVTRAALPAVDYQTAIEHAVRAGYSRAAAIRMANRFYQPGERGRPFGKAAQAATANVFSGVSRGVFGG